MRPKIALCAHAEKVADPIAVSVRDGLSFILASTRNDRTEALLSFWGEPFMSSAAGRDVPRYIFFVDGTSELIARFVDIERTHRMRRPNQQADQPM
jgi:hypothetical protein